MYNKPLAEISLTVAAAYGTYIVADQLFGVSPVLAVVFLGKPKPVCNTNKLASATRRRMLAMLLLIGRAANRILLADILSSLENCSCLFIQRALN